MNYVIFFMMCIMQEIFLPIPEASTIVLGLISIGSFNTFVLGIIGVEIGIILMYDMVFFFKNKYLKKYENNKKYKAYQRYISKNPFLTTGLLFAIPILPDEIIIIGSVLGNIPLKHLLLISLISKTISIGTFAFSEMIATVFALSQWQVIIVTIIIMVALSIVYKRLNQKVTH